MPGRQAHGRSLVAAPTTAKNSKKSSKARSQKNALNAFGIAQELYPTRQKRTPRAQDLDAEIERKHGRDEDEDEDDEDEEAPRRKKAKAPRRATDDGAEYGSDSEGNEWRLGGMAEDDEDSEIESDDAFNESDDDKFQGYSFRGSKTGNNEDHDSEDDSQDDEGETLGADAIDLATALDQYEETSEEEQEGSGSGNSDSDEEASDESGFDDEDDAESDDEDGEEADPKKLEALRGLVSGFGGDADDAQGAAPAKQKIGLSDLGLTGLNDPLMKKAVKMMNKEEKAKTPGASKKLAVPLARRQQDRLDRSAAYEKTNETLDRWKDTVKANRRAEHLIFPLPQNSALAGVDTTEIRPLTAVNSNNELESTIMSIMEQSGLSLEKEAKPKKPVYDEDGNELTRKEIQNQKRMERELNSREAKRARRIKKIKSKAYHRVHRKERERGEIAEREAMAEAGELDSEAEQEAQDRRRALERVGQRHKESKWAKLGSKAKRAVWDDEFRAGLTEMARKDEELRRRKEGKTAVSDDDSDTSSDGDSDDDAALRRRLDRLEADDEEDEPQSALMGLKFMQKAEAAKKKANDDIVRQIRKDLDGEDDEDSDDEVNGDEVGRRQYGAPATTKHKDSEDDETGQPEKKSKSKSANSVPAKSFSQSALSGAVVNALAPVQSTADTTGGAWSRGEVRRKKTKGPSRIEDLDLNANVMVATQPAARSKATTRSSKAKGRTDDDDTSDSDSDAEADKHLPLAIRDQDLVARAFAGEDVVGDFQREKDEVAEADDDKIVDNTLPGWGSWVGEGVSAKEKKRHQGRFLTKVDGVKKNKRQDAKLEKVIINEKRIKKNDRYLASQLPHQFESRDQYERSLRLPVGPEWQTKETFQSSTKPRVLMKPGIIAPMSKPMV